MEHFAIIFSTFSNNEAVDSSTLSALFVPVGFEGTNIFDNNRGGGIEVIKYIIYYHLFILLYTAGSCYCISKRLLKDIKHCYWWNKQRSIPTELIWTNNAT